MRPGLLRLIGIVIALAAADRCAAALPSIVFDLRVHDTGGKEVTLINPGDSVTLDLYTVASGLNGTSVDDNVTWINGSFLSSQGGLLGDLQGLPVPSIRTPPSTVGTAQDLDSDGDLDVGGTTPSSATGYYLSDQPLSIPLSVPPQLAGGTLLGQVQFTLKSAGNLTTSVTWSSRPALQGLIAYFDGNTADSYDWDPTKLDLSYSPVTIRGAAPDGSGNLQLQGTVVNHYSVTGNAQAAAGQTLSFIRGVNVTPTGSLTGGAVAVNNATSGNAGGTFAPDSLAIGTTANGTFTQSAGTTRTGDVKMGTAVVTGNITINGGRMDTGAVTFGGAGSSILQTGGVFTMASLSLSHALAQITGGSMTTSGSLDDKNGSTLDCGATPGVHVGGNFTEDATSHLAMAFAGVGTNQFAAMTIDGSASLVGALDLSKLPTFSPGPNDQLTILTATGGISGTFSNAAGLVTFDGIQCDVVYSPNGVTLENFALAPEPGTGLILGITAVLACRRRTRFSRRADITTPDRA